MNLRVVCLPYRLHIVTSSCSYNLGEMHIVVLYTVPHPPVYNKLV
jgi:hypothetical protein